MVVQELNDSDERRFKRLSEDVKDDNYDYRLIWEGFINQFEFTDTPHAAYSVYRLLQFCLYVVETFPKRFKEYLVSFNFSTPLEFIGSFTVLAQIATQENPDKAFRKVNFIHSENPVQGQHLREMNIAPLIKNGKKFNLSDIKMYPLCSIAENNYQIIDQQLFLKKIYVGPFFELIKKTSLTKDLGINDQVSFNKYSTLIAEAVLEKRCFKEIINSLRKSKYDFLYFDDGNSNCPDAYYRSNKTIFLIEFKGYVFPTNLSDNPDFAKIKSYLDERFIEKEGSVLKGIGQIAKQIQLLANGFFKFDATFNNDLCHKAYTVYPIICHTDYYFSMPGVNDYLNREFKKKIVVMSLPNATVNDVILIDLVHLFDMIHYGKDFSHLQRYIDAYYRRMSDRKRLQAKQPNIPHFLNSYAGFDEMYKSHFSEEVRNGAIVKQYINGLINDGEQKLKKPL